MKLLIAALVATAGCAARSADAGPAATAGAPAAPPGQAMHPCARAARILRGEAHRDQIDPSGEPDGVGPGARDVVA